MGNLEQFVLNVLEKKYPQLKQPSIVYASVTAAQELPEYWYQYSLRVLDRFGNEDSAYPEMPDVRSRQRFDIDTVVAIGLAYGIVEPVIIGEVVL